MNAIVFGNKWRFSELLSVLSSERNIYRGETIDQHLVYVSELSNYRQLYSKFPKERTASIFFTEQSRESVKRCQRIQVGSSVLVTTLRRASLIEDKSIWFINFPPPPKSIRIQFRSSRWLTTRHAIAVFVRCFYR